MVIKINISLNRSLKCLNYFEEVKNHQCNEIVSIALNHLQSIQS